MKIAVIGAGFAGLSAAYDLAGAGHEVTVLDANDRPGGLAAGFQDPSWDWPLEHFYHHIFLSDEAILGLAEEIGFRERIMALRPVSASFIEGEAMALDGVLPILRFGAIPFPDRVRMGAVGAWLKLTGNWRALETVTAHDWLLRWMGPRAYAVVWEPLLIGKFGEGHYREVPMSWLWARIHARTFKLGYMEGGFQAFADALRDAVAERGAEVRLGRRVESVRTGAETQGGLLLTSDEGEERFDRVIFTSGPHLLARLTPELPEDYLAGLRSLDYLGAVVATLALDRSLLTDGTYWLNMDKRDFPFLAVVEHTNLLDRAHYGGDHLLYVGDYLEPDHPFVRGEGGDEAVLDAWLPALSRIRPDFDPSWVRASWVHRAAYAQPVVPRGFSSQVPPLATPIPGLYLASMSQVYPWDRGTNFAVEIGRRVAEEILAGAGDGGAG